jgi:hypothetical protein
MAYKRRDPKSETICSVAAMRAGVALRTANALMPGATNRQLMRAARRILWACDGRDRMPKISEAQCRDLISPHLQCIARDCHALHFWNPIARSMNLFFREED